MKKFCHIVLYIFMATRLISSGTLRIISPNGNENWQLGGQQQITWEANDITNPIKLVLFKDGVIVGLIIRDLDPTPSSYSWNVGQYSRGMVTPGSGYKIRIRELGTADNRATDDSNDPFTISREQDDNTINVTNPGRKSVWHFDSKYKIKWQSSQSLPSQVKIQLYQVFDRITTITPSTSNQAGEYDWTIPRTIPSGTYRIKVITSDDRVWDWSKNFKIIGLAAKIKIPPASAQKKESTKISGQTKIGGPMPQFRVIEVSKPDGQDTWFKGHRYSIQWNKSGRMPQGVKISLYQNNTLVLNITDYTGNDGSYPWTIPESVSLGLATINIKTVDDAVYDNSDTFMISDPPVITVTSPHSGDNLQKGDTHTIVWATNGPMADRVKIQLFQGGTWILDIINSTENNNSYDWLVPQSISASTYFVRIITADDLVSDDSDSFTISNPPPAAPDPALENYRQELGALINQHRQNHGLNPMVLDPCINIAAQQHSEWMNANSTFDHIGQNGTPPPLRCQNAGCWCSKENIYQGETSNHQAADCFEKWRTSPRHNNIMLTDYLTKIGIGRSGRYVTADFN